VDVIAPGVSIKSSYLNNTYANLSGTSMACPFVAASAALLLSNNPLMNPEEICDTLTDNSTYDWSTRHDSTFYYTKPVLYIGNIIISPVKRTKRPTFSIESGYYTDRILLEISCEEEAKIYYTLDGSRCTTSNGILYTEPITINSFTRVHAIAIAQDKMHSQQSIAEYYLTSADSEDNFEIDSNGIITAYTGSNDYLTVPDIINGITVKGIGDEVFRVSSIVMIELPDSLISVGENAFRGCKSLYSFDCKNLKQVGKNAFRNCEALTNIDLSNLEEVSDYGFYSCVSISGIYNDKLSTIKKYSFYRLTNAVNINLPNVKKVEMNGLCTCLRASEIFLPNVEYLGRSALNSDCLVQRIELPKLHEMDSSGYQFLNMKSLTELCLPNLIGEFPQYAINGTRIETLILNKAESISENGLNSVYYLEKLYIPNVITINGNIFDFNAPNLKILFAPKAEMINRLPNNADLAIFVSNELRSVTENDTCKCTVVAPGGSYAEEWATDNNHSFVDSFSMVNYKFSYIKNDLLCVDYFWENIDEIEQYADSISYSFEVNGEDADAAEIKTSGDKTFFSYRTNSDDEQTVRAVVNIDGMLFKSAPVTVSRSAVAEPDNGCEHKWIVSKYDNIYSDTIVTLHCQNCGCDYQVSFSNYLNSRSFSPLDLNNDGIVNAKDFAIIQKQCS